MAQGFSLDLCLYLIICKSTISRFWVCWRWEFIIFDERDIFLGPQGRTGTILVPVEIELVPRFGLLPYPLWSVIGSVSVSMSLRVSTCLTLISHSFSMMSWCGVGQGVCLCLCLCMCVYLYVSFPSLSRSS